MKSAREFMVLAVFLAWSVAAGSKVDISFDVDVCDTDGFGNDRAVCYMSVGSWENWRPDKDRLPNKMLDNKYRGWPGEK